MTMPDGSLSAARNRDLPMADRTGAGSRTAPANARSRHSVSLAIETFVSRATSSSGSPRNSRATIAIFR